MEIKLRNNNGTPSRTECNGTMERDRKVSGGSDRKLVKDIMMTDDPIEEQCGTQESVRDQEDIQT